MYPEPGPVRAVDQRITRYSFSPMRLKIHSAVRVWFAISRQVTRDTWVRRIHRVQKRATTDLNGHEIRCHVGNRAAHGAEARPKSTRRRSPGRTGSPERGLIVVLVGRRGLDPRTSALTRFEPTDFPGGSAPNIKVQCELPTQPGPRLTVNSAIEPDATTGCSAVVVSPANRASEGHF
jgi:hypothetical protein